MIIVAGSMKARSGRRQAVLDKSKESIVLARKAPGCYEFSVTADAIEEDRIAVFERWESMEALRAFRGSGPSEGLKSDIEASEINEYVVMRHGS
jgi:quinol monooxygenase YgiN